MTCLSQHNYQVQFGFLTPVAYTFLFLGSLTPCESHIVELLQIVWLYTTDTPQPGLHQQPAWLGTQLKGSQTSFLL